MKKKLYLIRHSYASDPGGTHDFDRPLTLEGQSKVRVLGRHLSTKDFEPDRILCSPALRTTETAKNLLEELQIAESILEFRADIYNASVRELLQLVNSLPEAAQQVAIIGHNPAISYFSEFIADETIGGMEPCSVVTIRLEDVKWEEVSQGDGTFVSYLHPNRLNV